MTRVLVTGATGFVGRPLIQALTTAGYIVRATTHDSNRPPILGNAELITGIDLLRPVDWRPLMDGVDSIVHLAGTAHKGAAAPQDVYDRVNHAATAELAEAAKRSAVNHLIFISSIAAQSGPSAGELLTESATARPSNDYGRSKLAAERALIRSEAPFTILRPAVIFGPGVKGNLQTLMRLAALPLPLPFGAFSNRRSLLSVSDLIIAIRLILEIGPTFDTFVLADPKPETLAEIIAALRKGLGRGPGLVPIPPNLLRYMLQSLGKRELWERIGGELIVDPSRFIEKTGWSPPASLPESLAAFAQAEAASSDGAN